MSLLPQQPVSIAKLLDLSFRLYFASFKSLLGLSVILSAAYILFAYFTVDLLTPAAGAEGTAAEFAPDFTGFLGAMSVFVLLTFIFYGAVIYRIDNVANQRSDSLGESLTAAIQKLPTVAWALLLYYLAIFVGSLLLVIPGLILGLSLSFFLFFIILDGLSGFDSLTASHKLVWGHWWRTMGVYMAPGILMVIFYAMVGFLNVAMADEAQGAQGFGVEDIITNTLTGIVMPYFYALGYVVFNDLKLRKSGDDLAKRLSS